VCRSVSYLARRAGSGRRPFGALRLALSRIEAFATCHVRTRQSPVRLGPCSGSVLPHSRRGQPTLAQGLAVPAFYLAGVAGGCVGLAPGRPSCSHPGDRRFPDEWVLACWILVASGGACRMVHRERSASRRLWIYPPSAGTCPARRSMAAVTPAV